MLPSQASWAGDEISRLQGEEVGLGRRDQDYLGKLSLQALHVVQLGGTQSNLMGRELHPGIREAIPGPASQPLQL